MRHRRGSGSRMPKTWSSFTNAGQVAISTTQSVVSIQTPATVHTRTLLRSRGEILLVGTPDAATDSDVVGLGLIIVNENAGGVGGVSVPGPINDPEGAWLWHQFVPLDAVGQTAATADSAGAIVRVPVDSKAMRKIGVDEAICLVAELSSGDFASVTLTHGIRLLFGD